MPEGANDTVLKLIDPENVPYAIVVLVVAFVLVRLLDRGLARLGEAFTARRMLFSRLATFSRFTVYVLAAFLALSSVLRLSSQAVFALSGTLAVTLGFAFKDLAASALAGLTILLDAPFQVGDRVQFGSYYGEVKQIGLRSVRLVTLDDNLVTIPSNKFLTEAVASANAGSLDAMVVMAFAVAPDADHVRAGEIVRDAVTASKYVYVAKPITLLVSTRIAGAYVITELTAKAYVFDVRYEKAFASDVTDRVLQAFRRDGIRPPAVAIDGLVA